MQADSSKQRIPSNVFGHADKNPANLDIALANFLTMFFPVEVKLKQRENERDSGIDRYGESYAKCIIL